MIHFIWGPARVGVVGNELAGKYGKGAAENVEWNLKSHIAKYKSKDEDDDHEVLKMMRW